MKASVLERGPAVSLDLVAERLGVSTPALLKRFGTRRELMIAALKPPERSAWLDFLARGPDARPLADQLEELLAKMIDFFAEAMPCLVALRESGIPWEAVYSPLRPPPAVEGVRVMTRWLEQAREEKLVATDACETVATAILGAVQARAFIAHPTNKPFTARAQATYLRELTQLSARALAPARRRPLRSRKLR